MKTIQFSILVYNNNDNHGWIA